VFDQAPTTSDVAWVHSSLVWQPQLLDAAVPAYDGGAVTTRHRLDATSWVDHTPGWLVGADAVLADLAGTASWSQRTVVMYGRSLPEPRLTARWDDRGWPAVLERARALLSDRYATPFTSVGVNLYRDGRDSVAWHRDRVHRLVPADALDGPLVATLTLGATRRFQLRPRSAGPTPLTLLPRCGDLVVMGGRCQLDWEHTVPKVRASAPRMAVTLRTAYREVMSNTDREHLASNIVGHVAKGVESLTLR